MRHWAAQGSVERNVVDVLWRLYSRAAGLAFWGPRYDMCNKVSNHLGIWCSDVETRPQLGGSERWIMGIGMQSNLVGCSCILEYEAYKFTTSWNSTPIMKSILRCLRHEVRLWLAPSLLVPMILGSRLYCECNLISISCPIGAS
jgi:hypothetical protein